METVSPVDKRKIALTFDTEWWGRAHLVTGAPLHQGLERDVRAVYEILELLSAFGARATFFIVADDFSRQVRADIAGQGSEIASHSVTHPLFSKLPGEQWRHEIVDSKRMLEDQTGTPVTGFRAPSWSVPYEMKDRFIDLLKESGYRYDSSFCSFKTPLYGDPRFPRTPELLAENLVEIPLPRVGIPAWPWVGGFYFRLIPNIVLARFVRQEAPAFLYFHPWEFYDGVRVKLSPAASFATYYGRTRNKDKLRRLLASLEASHRFVPLGEIAEDWLAGAGPPATSRR